MVFGQLLLLNHISISNISISPRLVHDVPEHRPEEGGRLSRSRLGQADDVAPRQDGRDALGLVFLKVFFYF